MLLLGELSSFHELWRTMAWTLSGIGTVVVGALALFGEQIRNRLFGPRLTLAIQCAVQRRVSSVGEDTHPATFAPAGSNRSSRGGNEAAEAFGVEGRMAT